ncbi:MAG: hypothetical protein JWN70_997 [Planctomycetaceae bacterium]|nr:hypothetical protein [Planctomycetaceae bacterium]
MLRAPRMHWLRTRQPHNCAPPPRLKRELRHAVSTYRTLNRLRVAVFPAFHGQRVNTGMFGSIPPSRNSDTRDAVDS